jgi:hypothetical protein
VRTHNRKATLFLAGWLFFLVPAAAQMNVGDNVQLTGNGNLSGGYSDNWGNQIGSSHGFNFGGVASIGGYYYSPNFLSFNVTPYYNQNWANSNFQTTTNSSGIALSSSVFAGSKFPGSVSYSADFNKEGTFSLPGSQNYVTNGNGQGFGVGWSANLPDAPSVSVGYSYGNSNYSVYGTNENGSTSFNNFFVHSAYRWDNFSLAGGFNHNNSNAEIPQIFSTGQEESSTSDSTGYYFTVAHPLPLHGSTSVNFNRTDLNSDYLGYSFNGTIDTISAFAGVNPTSKWSVSTSANYTDNLNGVLYQSIVPTGASTTGAANLAAGGTTAATAPAQTTDLTQSESSHAWDFTVGSGYAIAPNLQIRGQYEWREQLYNGINYTASGVTVGAIYGRTIFGGSFNANAYVTDNDSSNISGSQIGFSTNASYNRQFGRWNVTMSGGYGQNLQTLLVAYTTSSYSYAGSVGRRFGAFVWTANAGASHSLLTGQPDSAYSSQSYGTALGVKRLSFSANYNQSSGSGLASGGGVNPTPPLPPIIPPSLLIMYGGTSYAFSASGSPVRRWTLSGTYLKANSDTTNQGIFSANKVEEEIFSTQYQFRKVGVNGGYSHLIQGFSASGVAPANFSAVYIGLYRWFNFF